jgi:hypothetical protein
MAAKAGYGGGSQTFFIMRFACKGDVTTRAEKERAEAAIRYKVHSIKLPRPPRLGSLTGAANS